MQEIKPSKIWHFIKDIRELITDVNTSKNLKNKILVETIVKHGIWNDSVPDPKEIEDGIKHIFAN